MEARVKEEKIFKPIELLLKKTEEAEVLWALLSMSDSAFKDILTELPRLRGKDGMTDMPIYVLHNMFQELNRVFTPEWHKDRYGES